MEMVKCRNCNWFDWDWVSLSHGGSAKLCYCMETQNSVIDPSVDRDCPLFKERESKGGRKDGTSKALN